MFKNQRRPLRSALFIRWTRVCLLVMGILALSYCAVVLLDSQAFQAYQSWRFGRAVKNTQTSAILHPQRASSPFFSPKEANRARPASFGIDGLAESPLGRIEISTIGHTAMIMEGVDVNTLRHAVGHIPNTPLPGQPGNVALTGHRDTFFRGLRKIHEGDEITLTTLQGLFRYRVDWAQVVGPGNTQLLGQTTDDLLTLVTCYPFYFVGPAPKRCIVRAHRISD